MPADDPAPQPEKDVEEVAAELLRLLSQREIRPDNTKARDAVAEVVEAVQQFRRTVESALSRLTAAVEEATEQIGMPPGSVRRLLVRRELSRQSDVTLGRPTLTIPRTLTTFLELDPPDDLREVFAAKRSRPRGPGWSDTLTMTLDQVVPMIEYLRRSRTTSGQYQHINKAIEELSPFLVAERD